MKQGARARRSKKRGKKQKNYRHMKKSQSSIRCASEIITANKTIISAITLEQIKTLNLDDILHRLEGVLSHYINVMQAEIKNGTNQQASKQGLYFVAQHVVMLIKDVSDHALLKFDISINRIQLQMSIQLLDSIHSQLQDIIKYEELNADISMHLNAFSNVIVALNTHTKCILVDGLGVNQHDIRELLEIASNLSDHPPRIPNMYDKNLCDLDAYNDFNIHATIVRCVSYMFLLGYQNNLDPRQIDLESWLSKVRDEHIPKMLHIYAKMCGIAALCYIRLADIKTAWKYLSKKDMLCSLAAQNQKWSREYVSSCFKLPADMLLSEFLRMLSDESKPLRFADQYSYYHMLKSLREKDPSSVPADTLNSIYKTIEVAYKAHWKQLRVCRNKIRTCAPTAELISVPAQELYSSNSMAPKAEPYSQIIRLEIPCDHVHDAKFKKMLSIKCNIKLAEIQKIIPSYYYHVLIKPNKEKNRLIITGLRTCPIEYIDVYCDAVIETIHKYEEHQSKKHQAHLASMLETSKVGNGPSPEIEVLNEEKHLTGYIYKQWQDESKTKRRNRPAICENETMESSDSDDLDPSELFGGYFDDFEIKQLQMLSSHNAQIYVAMRPGGLQQGNYDQNIQDRFNILFDFPKQARYRGEQGFKFRDVNGLSCPVAKILKSTCRALPYMAVQGKGRAVLYIYDTIVIKDTQQERNHTVIETSYNSTEAKALLDKLRVNSGHLSKPA